MRAHARRALLPAAFLVALASGLGVWWATRPPAAPAVPAAPAMSDDEQRAWRELEASGASLYGEPGRRQHLRGHLALLDRTSFPGPTRQELRSELNAPVRSADLWSVPLEAWPAVGRLKSLHRLQVTASDLRGDPLRHVARLPHLKAFESTNSPCLPDDLASLKDAPSLERLDVMLTVFDTPAADRRERLGELTEAELAWADDYRARHPDRENIVEASILTDRMLAALQTLPNLKSLRLANTSVSDRGLASLSTYPALEELDLRHARAALTPKAVATFRRLRPDCRLILGDE